MRWNPATGANTELKSASRIDKDSDLPNWELSPDGNYLARSILKPNQDAAIRILSIADGSDSTVEVKGWSVLIGIYWSADGKKLWAGGVNPKHAGFGGANTSLLLEIGLDGKVRVMPASAMFAFTLAYLPRMAVTWRSRVLRQTTLTYGCCRTSDRSRIPPG